MKDIKTKNKNIFKIVSILLAVLLWIYVINQSDDLSYNKTIKSKVEYFNVPDEFSVEGPNTVNVKVWGTQKETGDIVTYVDLTGLDEGIHLVKVQANPIKGALLTRVEPDKIEIRIGAQQKKNMKIRHEITGQLPLGYSLVDLLIVPEQCIVQGEEQQIKKIVSIVAPLELSVTQSLSEHRVNLQARDFDGNIITEGVTLIPQTAQVFTVVEAERITRRVDVEPEFSGIPEAGFIVKKVVYDPQQVTVAGPKQIIEQLKILKTVNFSLEGIKESFTTQVEIQVPEGIVVFPTTLEISVEIEKTNSEEG